MLQKINKLYIVAFLLLIAIVGYVYYINKEPIETINLFIASVYEGNYETARDLSTGFIKWNLNDEYHIKSELKHIKINKIRTHNNYSKAIITVEYYNEYPNVSWYEVELIKKDNWKIYSLTELKSFPDTRSFITREKNIEKVAEVFANYINAILENKPAEQYLAGLAFKAHSNNNLPDLSIKDFKDLTATTISSDNKQCIVQFDYTLSERNVSVIVYSYNLDGEWKIVRIEQI